MIPNGQFGIMTSIDEIARMLEPDNEIARIRMRLRLRELATEMHLYRRKHPNTTLSSDKILKRVKHAIAWRIIRNYLFFPLRPFRQALRMLYR